MFLALQSKAALKLANFTTTKQAYLQFAQYSDAVSIPYPYFLLGSSRRPEWPGCVLALFDLNICIPVSLKHPLL